MGRLLESPRLQAGEDVKVVGSKTLTQVVRFGIPLYNHDGRARSDARGGDVKPLPLPLPVQLLAKLYLPPLLLQSVVGQTESPWGQLGPAISPQLWQL